MEALNTSNSVIQSTEPYSTPQPKRKKQMVEVDNIWLAITNRYTLQRTIGQGGYGHVMKGEDILTGKKVAIKLVRNVFKDANRARGVVSEIQIMNQLSQMGNNCFTPELLNTIMVPDGDEQNLFIVMDFVQSDLNKVLKTTNKIGFKESHIKVLLYNGLTCLSYLNSANLMHRDIKPSNILVDSNCQIKLCDFGFARTIPPAMNNKFSDDDIYSNGSIEFPTFKSPQASLSKKIVFTDTKVQSAVNFMRSSKKAMNVLNSDRFRKIQLVRRQKNELKERQSKKMKRQLSMHVVTRQYRPPEVLLREPCYNSSLDVWSFGCILAEMMTCANPEKTTKGVLKRHLFPGTSSVLISPCKAINSSKYDMVLEFTDQLKVILSKLGPQQDIDTAFITTPQST